jgi:hypothetical protein
MLDDYHWQYTLHVRWVKLCLMWAPPYSVSVIHIDATLCPLPPSLTVHSACQMSKVVSNVSTPLFSKCNAYWHGRLPLTVHSACQMSKVVSNVSTPLFSKCNTHWCCFVSCPSFMTITTDSIHSAWVKFVTVFWCEHPLTQMNNTQLASN